MNADQPSPTTRLWSSRTGKFAAAIAATGCLMALAAATADASAGTSPPSTCSWPSPSAVFKPWNDYNMYFLMNGGSFDRGSAGWTLNGGASIGTPNEPNQVSGGGDSMSLGIPNGASVTSAPVCVTAKTPALRLFSINTGGPDRKMQVFVNYTGTDGRPHSAKLPDQQAGASWAPSQPLRFADQIKDVLNTYGQATVTFTFASPYQKDRPGNWRIDDVYLEDITGICDWPTMSTPFTPWSDSNPYFLADGGSFETAGTPWTLTGGASVGSPNETWKVNGGGDSMSLGIPNGASATSPPVCVTADSPALRLFYVNTGGSDRPLQIVLNYKGTDGKPHSAKLPDQKNNGAWAPSTPIMFLGQLQDVLKVNGQTLVTFTFTSPAQTDRPAAWRIDDVAIDPLKSH